MASYKQLEVDLDMVQMRFSGKFLLWSLRLVGTHTEMYRVRNITLESQILEHGALVRVLEEVYL